MEKLTKKIKGYKSAKAMFNAMDKKRKLFQKKHPIRYRLEEIYYFCIRQLRKIPQAIREVKWFFQRGKRGWSNSDTWEFDTYLAKVISEGIKHLKEINHGLPTYDEGKSELEAINEWDCILNTIHYTFVTAEDISKGSVVYIPSKLFTKKRYDELVKSMEDGFVKYKTYHHVLTLKEIQEYEKGWEYFKEYFHSLWD